MITGLLLAIHHQDNDKPWHLTRYELGRVGSVLLSSPSGLRVGAEVH